MVTALFLAWQVIVLGVLETHFGSGYDDRRFDTLEARFEHRQEAFAEADARMSELAAVHPRAERIGWSLALICVREPGRAADSCKPTSARDKARYESLGGVDVIVRQSHDKHRTFFRFYADDPPRYTLLHAPADTDVSSYAADRGFRTTRSLTSGWTLLGPIPDVHREDEQWQ
ncbi:hypothetical protein ACTWJ8_35420 [Streptomyces sp. SDT5-1]|uniref:hypothetical protein n=1 Tax=Streptomyces sp. SDT5-1 TaxID=3406418 RepID=UPI003FD3D107